MRWMLPNVLDKYPFSNKIIIWAWGCHIIQTRPIDATCPIFHLKRFPNLLINTLADWLDVQDDDVLDELAICRQEIDPSSIYSRIILGRYLQAQYYALIGKLEEAGIEILEYPKTRVTDIYFEAEDRRVNVITAQGKSYPFSKAVIATGHRWQDDREEGRNYYSSPWPIFKLLPRKGEYYDFAVGTLGASLSAFDVVNSLARRHGNFALAKDGTVTYQADKDASGFRVVMHDANSWLPQLQYEQENPMREIYRHASRDSILQLIDDKGFLRIETFFNRVCRPALIEAFEKDSFRDMIRCLADPAFGLIDFIRKMERRHEYKDAFEGMRIELEEAQQSIRGDRPIHWKEVMDDLMYALNFHAELMPAEDHLLFHEEVMPFLMNVIAAMPLPSARLLLALRDAGRLDLVGGFAETDGQQSTGSTTVTVHGKEGTQTLSYGLFVDCGGQKLVDCASYPFQSLVKEGVVRPARARFAEPGHAVGMQQGKYRERVFQEGEEIYLSTGGIDVDACYRIIGKEGKASDSLYDISFTHVCGVRPYSYGLQACDATARIAVECWVRAVADKQGIPAEVEAVSRLYQQDE